MVGRKVLKRRSEFAQPRQGGRRMTGSVRRPPLKAVQTGGRQYEWRQDSINFGDRPAADDGERRSKAVRQMFEKLRKAARGPHGIRRGCDFDQRAVKVEKQGVSRGDAGRLHAGRCGREAARHSNRAVRSRARRAKPARGASVASFM